MNWHWLTEQIIQIAELGMLVVFVVEVMMRTTIMTLTEIRKAITSLRSERSNNETSV